MKTEGRAVRERPWQGWRRNRLRKSPTGAKGPLETRQGLERWKQRLRVLTKPRGLSPELLPSQAGAPPCPAQPWPAPTPKPLETAAHASRCPALPQLTGDQTTSAEGK